MRADHPALAALFERTFALQIAVPPPDGAAAAAFTFVEFSQVKPIPIELNGAGVT